MTFTYRDDPDWRDAHRDYLSEQGGANERCERRRLAAQRMQQIEAAYKRDPGRGARVARAHREIEEWAERLAASLPPLTAEEAVTVGHLAGALDARRRALNKAQSPGSAPGAR